MLKSIYVKDYALIDQINLKFGHGLNIITGETGAGKSILIDALSLVLGDRASNDIIRKGSEKSVVEGIFEVETNKKVKALLEENEIEFQPELIIRREIPLKGNNRCFINDTPAQLSLVKDLGDLLVDLHGQHEHQSLLRPETHIDFLDEFGKTEDNLRTYRWLYNALNKLLGEIQELKNKENSVKEKSDVHAFQLKEIDSISPKPGEDEKINEELAILENSEKLLEITSGVYTNLYETENSIYDSLVRIKSELDKLAGIDPAFEEQTNECDSALTLLKDISEFIRSYNARIEIEPEKLEEMRARISSINMLKKKYGGSIESIIEFRNKIGEEYGVAENYSEKISQLETKIKAVRQNCGNEALKLSQVRRDTARFVEKNVKKILAELGISKSEFKVLIKQYLADPNSDNYIEASGKKYKFNSHGIDQVEFFISTNLGEDLKPLAKIASGGEISRIMLALKTILAKNDRLPILIFDEIDTGVSGPIAQKVGQSLKSLSAYHQIITITHLPQIAGLADHHFVVEKKIADSRSVSSVRILNTEDRIKEVATFMSGENVTEASLKGPKN